MPVFPSPIRILALLLVLSFSCARPVAAQQSAEPSSPPNAADQFRFRVNVNRVVVDVVVTDSNGKPVGGLTQKDFSLFEDGQPQNILSFDVHSLDTNPDYSRKLPPMPANTFVNIAPEPERGPLYVLLLDLVNTEQSDQPYARQQLLKFVQSKPQGTRFAVFVRSDGLHLVQGFTADRDQLYRTLDPAHSLPHVPRIFLLGGNYGHNDALMTTSVFRDIAVYLDGLPGRKNIIWISGLFPLDLFPHQDDRPDMRTDAQETLDALARSESAIYPVDVTGVQAFPAGRLTGATTGAGPASGPPGLTVSDAHTLSSQMGTAGMGTSLSENNTVQDVIANMTGGRAFYSRNDLGNVLEEATEAGSTYYTLTYSPSHTNFDGRMRKIQVVLSEKGDRLEYRRGYLATGPQSPILPDRYQERRNADTANLRPIGDSLSAYMQHGAPIARQVYFQVHVRALHSAQLATPQQMANLVDQPTYFQFRQRKRPNRPLAPIKLQPYLIEYQIIGRIPKFEVAAGVYDEESRLLNGDVEEASSANPGPSDMHSDFTYFRVQQRIDVPPGAVSLRLAVRDVSTDRMGTMEIPLPLVPEPVPATLSDSQSGSSPRQKP